MDITKKAKELFDKTVYDKLYVNPKGEFFSRKNYCDNSLKEGESCRVVTRQEVLEAVAKPKQLNAKETIALINEIETIEDLAAYDADDRKSVQEALAARHKALEEHKETDKTE